MSNAIKFTCEGGRISVHIAPENADSFRIDVEDTGIGIPAEQIDRLFAEFHQFDASSSKKIRVFPLEHACYRSTEVTRG